MTFVLNCWYVAAWSSEVQREPHYEKILGQHILLYRDSSGTAIAMDDTCPHRFAPLHMGKVVGDAIECPYHGLRFNSSRSCVHNPFNPKATPKAAKRHVYPLIERDTILWIWMGDPEQANDADIPDFHWLNQTDQYRMTAEGKLVQPVSTELVLDNLMDLSHGQFLHPTTLGNAAMAGGSTESFQQGRTVHSKRLNPNGQLPELFSMAGVLKPDTRVDFWNDMRWDPFGSYFLEVGVTPTGRPRDEGFFFGSAHLLTPVDETTNIYRYILFRDFAQNNAELTAGMEAIVLKAFTEEDEPMLAAVQDRMASRDFWSLKPLLLAGDKAAVLVRRTIDELKSLEREVETAANEERQTA